MIKWNPPKKTIIFIIFALTMFIKNRIGPDIFSDHKKQSNKVKTSLKNLETFFTLHMYFYIQIYILKPNRQTDRQNLYRIDAYI